MRAQRRTLIVNRLDSTKILYNYLLRFADDHGMPLFETSAKDDSKADHVESIFLTLAHKVKR